MSNILYLAQLNPNKLGSIEEFILFLGRELTRRGDKLFFGGISVPPPEIAALFAASGVETINLHASAEMKNAPSLLQQIRFMRQLVSDYRIDLVHVNFYALTSPLVLGVYLSSAAIVFTEHTSGLAPQRSLLKGWLSKAIHSLIALRVQKYIAVSDYVRERLRISHHVGDKKTITIYNGVNTERFIPLDREEARKMTGLPMHGAIVLAVAMLIPEKGLQHLLQAAALLQKENFWIVIAGEGWYRDELEKLAKGHRLEDRVIFLGRRSDVEQLVAAADVVAVPAIWAESFGLIIAEAMAGGRVVVASRIGGIPELIEDQQTGLLAAPGDAKALARAIQRLLTDHLYREGLIQNALQKVRTDFDLSQQVVKVADLYDQITKR